MIKEVYFIAENEGLGGSENLKVFVAARLLRLGIKSNLLAHRNSYIKNAFSELVGEFTFFDLKLVNGETHIHENAIALLTEMAELKWFSNNSRVLFWQVHPHMFLWECGTILRRIIFFVDGRTIFLKKGLIFMDTNVQLHSCNFLRLKRNRLDIQRLIYNEPSIRKTEFDLNTTFNFCFIGRAVKHKVIAALSIMIFAIRAFKMPFKFYILTDNSEEFRNQLLQFFDQLPAQVEFIENMHGVVLHSWLKDHADTIFCNGLGAIECSIIGIPTVLTHGSYEIYPDDYLLMPYYMGQEGYVGEFIFDREFPVGYRYEEFFNRIIDVKFRRMISELGYKKAFEEHVSDIHLLRLVEKMNISKLKKKSLISKRIFNLK